MPWEKTNTSGPIESSDITIPSGQKLVEGVGQIHQDEDNWVPYRRRHWRRYRRIVGLVLFYASRCARAPGAPARVGPRGSVRGGEGVGEGAASAFGCENDEFRRSILAASMRSCESILPPPPSPSPSPPLSCLQLSTSRSNPIPLPRNLLGNPPLSNQPPKCLLSLFVC